MDTSSFVRVVQKSEQLFFIGIFYLQTKLCVYNVLLMSLLGDKKLHYLILTMWDHWSLTLIRGNREGM